VNETAVVGAEPLRVRVVVLGPTRALIDGSPVALGGPRQRAVLARLAVEPGVAVTDDRLVDDLWGDDAPPSVIVTLQGYVSGLRRALGDPSVIVRRGSGYALALPPEAVDAIAFERLADDVDRRLTSEPDAAALAVLADELSAARADWGGDPWVDHLGDPWTITPAAVAATTRRRLDRAIVEVLLQLGRPAAALAELAGARDRDPLDEDLAAAEMTALYRLGRQADALAVAGALRGRLLDELGLDPSPRLAELSLAILRHELDVPTPRAASTPTSESTSAPTPTPTPMPGRVSLPTPILPERVLRVAARPFVGRVAHLDRLAEVMRRPLDGSCVVVVRGEPGIGKTALVARMATEAPAGRPVVWTRCLDHAVVARQVLHDFVQCVLSSGDGRIDGALLRGREHLARLVPALSVAAGELPSSTPIERWEIDEAVRWLIGELAGHDGLVVVVDDVQWIDPSSAAVFAGLLREGHLDRVTLVVTRRTTGADPNPALDDLIVAAHRFGSVTEIDLRGLSLEETALLVGSGTDATTVSELHRRTNGHPLHLGALAGHEGDGIPPSLRDLFTARLEALATDALDVVRAVAVLGSSATLGAVSAMCRLDLDATVAAVDAAIRAGFLTDGDETLDTVHALVGEAVLAHAGRARAAALHVRAAAALDEVGASPPEIAFHLIAAGPAVPPAQRRRAALDAARHALGQFAYEEAIRWCEPADAERVPDALRAEIATVQSLALRSAGFATAARDAARRGLDHARSASDPILFAEAANMLAIAHDGMGFSFGGMDHEIDRALAEAAAWLPADARRLRARMLSFRVANGVTDHDPTDLRTWSGEALDLVDPVGDPRTLTVALLADRLAHWMPDQISHRLTRSLEATSAAQRSPSMLSAATAQVYLVADLIEAGHPREAFAAWRELRSIARRLRQPLFDSFVLFFEATFSLLRGHADRATRLSALGLTRAMESQGANGELAFAAQTFLAARDRGSLGDLLPLVVDTVDRFPDLGVWRAGLAIASIAAGDLDGAAHTLATVVRLDGTLDLRADSMWTLGAALAAESAAILGDDQRGAAAAAALRPFRGRWVVGGLGGAVLGPVDLPLGLALAVSRRLDEALDALDSAVASCEVGARVPLARALAARADVLDRLGRNGSADRRRAAAIAARVGLVLSPSPPA
jgi:DNA-binding SARP family transcriptional activator